jgi:hypothetical protein
MAPTDDLARRCPACSASLDGRELKCWLCNQDLHSREDASPFASPPSAAQAPARPVQFSLDTLFLAITLVAVCLGTTLAAPGLGFLLIVVAVPAVIRTIVARVRVGTADHRPTTGEKIVGFLASFGITAAVMTAGFATFAVVAATTVALCVGVIGEDPTQSPLGWSFMIMFYASPFLGLALTAWLFWRTWPRRKTGPPRGSELERG